MEMNVFKKIVHQYFKEKGFEKNKSKYYLNGEGFLCVIEIQRSYYGPTYYINYDFFLGKFERPYAIKRESIETYTPCVDGRFYFAEKHTYSCDYLDYTEEDLRKILDSNFRERILPPFQEGKKYLREHFGTLYVTFLPKERVWPFLED